MARIISLGCEAARVHDRYCEVHRALFGPTSYRQVITSLREGKESAYGKREQTLDELRGTLARLTTDVTNISEEEKRVRCADQMCTTLLEYIQTLGEVIGILSSICHKLGRDEKAYRRNTGKGSSPFGQDKIRYDQSRQKLERVGTRITKLFATY